MADHLTSVSSEDVYTRMLELNFPEQLALRFKSNQYINPPPSQKYDQL